MEFPTLLITELHQVAAVVGVVRMQPDWILMRQQRCDTLFQLHLLPSGDIDTTRLLETTRPQSAPLSCKPLRSTAPSGRGKGGKGLT